MDPRVIIIILCSAAMIFMSGYWTGFDHFKKNLAEDMTRDINQDLQVELEKISSAYHAVYSKVMKELVVETQRAVAKMYEEKENNNGIH